MIETNYEYIDLQSAHITQLTHDGIKTDWKIRKNITSEDLHALPAHLSDAQAKSILNFARKYELIAFNEGIKLQKKKQNEYLVAQIEELQMKLGFIESENVRLAEILEQHIGE